MEVCEGSERTEIIWRKAQIWKLCGIKKEFTRGKHLVILNEDSRCINIIKMWKNEKVERRTTVGQTVRCDQEWSLQRGVQLYRHKEDKNVIK